MNVCRRFLLAILVFGILLGMEAGAVHASDLLGLDTQVKSKLNVGVEFQGVVAVDGDYYHTPYSLKLQGKHMFSSRNIPLVNGAFARFLRWEDETGATLSTQISFVYDVQSGKTFYAVYDTPSTIQEVSRWYGASITKPMSAPFGMQTFEQQLDLMLPATAVRIDLNYWAWRNDPTDNTLGLPYKQFLDKIADWCYARGIRVIWSAHVFTRSSKNWSFQAKATFLITGKLNTPNADNISEDWTGTKEASYTLSWADYTQWITEIVQKPKLRRVMSALDIFNEPPYVADSGQRTIAESRYLEFMRQAVDAVRVVVPNLPVVAEGIPYWSPGFFLLPGKSINRGDVIYALHYYAWCRDPYADNKPETLIARAYAEGRYADGKQLMAQYFYDKGFFKLQDMGYPVLFTEVGTDSYLQEIYYSKWIQDLYDIARERNIGYLQHGFYYTAHPISNPNNPALFGMLNNDFLSLSDIGRLWHDNLTSKSK